MLDIEYNPYGGNMCYGLSKKKMVAWIKDFLVTYKKLTTRDAVIYTTTDWWTKCTGNTTKFRYDEPAVGRPLDPEDRRREAPGRLAVLHVLAVLRDPHRPEQVLQQPRPAQGAGHQREVARIPAGTAGILLAQSGR